MSSGGASDPAQHKSLPALRHAPTTTAVEAARTSLPSAWEFATHAASSGRHADIHKPAACNNWSPGTGEDAGPAKAECDGEAVH